MDAQGMNRIVEDGCGWLLGVLLVGGCALFIAGAIIGFIVAIGIVLT